MAGQVALDLEGADRNRQAVRAFVLLGLGFAAFQLWGYLTWLAHGGSPQFSVSVQIPSTARDGVILGEVLMPIVTIGWWAFVAQGVVRARALTWPLALTIVWGLTYWQESLANLSGPRFAYNSYFVDRGDWTGSLPFLHPSGPGLPQPLIMEPAVFLGLLPLISWIVAWATGRLRRSGLGLAVAAVLVYVVVLAVEFGAEMRSIAQGVHSYPEVFGALSIRAGKPDQFPLYENWLLGLMWFLPGLGVALMRDRRPSPRLVIAAVGALNVAFLLYNLIAFVWLPADTHSVQPPWLNP